MRVAIVLFSLLLVAPQARGGSSSAVAAAEESFEELADRAAEAWREDDLTEATRLYARTVELRPDWDEGWWYLGSGLYELQRYEECHAAFERFLQLKPEAGPGWTLLGLCEFGMGDRASARTSLEKALSLGVTQNAALHRATRWHLALAHIKDGRFELAMEPLTWLAQVEPERPGLVAAIGMNLLRMPRLPSEVPEDRRDLVLKTGRAGLLSLGTREEEAETAFLDLVEAYPDEPWVHYAHGAFLKKIDTGRALAEFRRELEVLPTNVYAHLEIAFELLLQGDPQGALGPGEQAVQLAPGLFAAHHALGRALVGVDRVEEGIVELETAARLAPDVPEMHFALQRAYARAGRTEDMERARARFAELEQQRRARIRAEQASIAKEPRP